ncbi:DUF7408 domain-containing protein [Paenibacillus sp. IHBB 10380]|uniref:DUF7408 domain-containing protein n=1 Tax=Paenibacillus sp. IHBB 10380 TaxID=1566358 RepID=UPI0005CFC98E|nr:hypothetical protein [Paenibacillus sp. IHBB 10380]AJS59823.1 hypothetical protein UB51_16555 [Paenibacillus sp. IHBB 10380]
MSSYIRNIKVMILPLIVLAMMVQSWVIPSTVYADDPSITIDIDLGYGSKLKDGRWNPVKITLTSDTDISGDIVIQSSDIYMMGNASYVQHVELPKDTEKEITLGIPGNHYNKDNNEIRFYQDSVEKGKYIPFKSGKSYLEGISVMGTGVIGVLSDDPDTMNFMNVLLGSGYHLDIVSLNRADIPYDPMLLDSLDILVINRFASDSLSKKQTASISEWVKSGGTLVLAGGAGYPKTAAAFADLSPVEYKGTFAVTTLPELAKLGGKPLDLEGEFTLSEAQPLEGSQVLYSAGTKPLFVSKQVEKGTVLYAAYDIAMAPVASWSGHPFVWASLLRADLPLQQNGGGMNSGNSMNNLSYILEYFPSLKMPQFSILLWMLIIYVIIVAPLLYFILKKVDKREWAWWIIPLIAVIASGAVYTIGSADKTKELAHTINILELDGHGSGTTMSASAFFTPSSGDYSLEFPKGTYLRIDRQSGSFGNSRESNSFIEVTDQSTQLNLLNMPQWSLAKIWAQQRNTNQVGQLDTQLSLNDQGEIEGEITNGTTSDLSNVVLVLGDQVYKLGDLGKNEKAKILNTTLSQSTNSNGGNIGQLLFPYTNSNLGNNFNRERELLMNYVPNTSWYATGSYIIGWSKDPMLNYSNKGKEMKSDQLNLWTQPVNVALMQNSKINIPFGFIPPIVTQVTAGSWNQVMNGFIDTSQGTANFEFSLPELDEATQFQEMTLNTGNPGQDTEYKIWDTLQQDWQELVWINGAWTVAKNIDKYIEDGKVIRLMVSTKSQTTLMLPQLRLKGTVKP